MTLPSEPISAGRRRIMRAVRSKDTSTEMAVRRLAHGLGYRFRLHRKELPGRPDLVFPSRRKVVFVHGCFWHQHDCPHGQRLPSVRTDYWLPKLAANRRRDADHEHRLVALGWDVLTVWECEIDNRSRLAARLCRFLGDAGGRRSDTASRTARRTPENP